MSACQLISTYLFLYFNFLKFLVYSASVNRQYLFDFDFFYICNNNLSVWKKFAYLSQVTVTQQLKCDVNSLLRQVRRILCPFVALTYIDSRTGSKVRVTLPTSNLTRFRFPTPRTTKPRLYSTVRQLVNAWPLVVIARSDHTDQPQAFSAVRTIVTPKRCALLHRKFKTSH